MGNEIFTLYSDLLADTKLSTSSIAPYGVRFNAVPATFLNDAGAFLHIGALGPYNGSVATGRDDVIHEIERAHAVCSSTRFILAGYSIGAHAVGDAIQHMPASDLALVAAAGLFGDPVFNATSASARGTFEPDHFGLLGIRGEWPSALTGKVFSYCHEFDPICNGSKRQHILLDGTFYIRDVPQLIGDKLHGNVEHTTYVSEGDVADAGTNIAAVLGFSRPIVPYSGPLDLAFAIDSTGSMGDVIGQVQANVADLVKGIAAIDSNFRVALVDYKDAPDQGDPYQARLDTTFTTNIGTFTTALDSLSASGGGDIPESVYSGIMKALGLSWRPGVRKLVIQIGDAAAKDPEPVTGFTLQDVRNKALAVDPAFVDTVQPGTDPDATASLRSIADATGGTYLNLPDRSDLSGLIPAIETDVTNGTTAPSAAIKVPSTAIVGSPVAVSAAASTDSSEAIVAYDWDFNGDGVYDLTTTSPVTSFTYSSPYSGNVVVRVRAKSGLAALASTAIAVVAPPSSPPPHPTNFAAAGGDSQVTLHWLSTAGSGAKWFTIYDGSGNVIDRIAANPDGTAPPGWIDTELTNAVPYTFNISAGNERGESTVVGPVTAIPHSPVEPTATAIASSANPSALHQPVTFTVTVTPTSGTGTPTGTVTFIVNDATGQQDVVELSGGIARLSTSDLAIGTHEIIALYSGAPGFSMSSANLTQQVNPFGPPATIVNAFDSSPQSAKVGTAFPRLLSVRVSDAFGNPVQGVLVTFKAPISGASGTFANRTTTTTNMTTGNGVTNASTFTANSTVGGPYFVSATVGSLSFSFLLSNTR